jgi:hypothetical protein
MNYQKPTIDVLPNALSIIQGRDKGGTAIQDVNMLPYFTAHAYEADE